MAQNLSYPSIRDLERLKPHINLAHLCRKSGVNYSAIRQRVNRHERGGTTYLNLDEKRKLQDGLLDLHEIITGILTKE